MDQELAANIAKIKSEPIDEADTDQPRYVQRKRRRLRRLAEPHEKERPSRIGFRKNMKRLALGTCIISIAFAVLLGHHLTLQKNASEGNILKDFLHSYRNHYNQIIHGQKDYCGAKLDPQALFTRIQNQSRILHQEEPLRQLEAALRNESRLNSIAVVGPPGVGKSLWARALEQHFPWRENVHSYAWNTFVRDEAEKFRLLRVFVNQISDCGSNLLVIDNLAPCDHELVTIFNTILTEAYEGSISAKTRVVVIYIFNLNSMESAAAYKRQYEVLQQLPNTKTINFRAFDKETLKDCIRHEAEMENLTLSFEAFEEIVATIDVGYSGCKNVHAKVLTFGRAAAKAIQDKTLI